MISLFKMAPENGAEVLSGVPECKKVVMGLMEKYVSQISFIQGMS